MNTKKCSCVGKCTCGSDGKCGSGERSEHVRLFEVLERIEERIDSLDRKLELMVKNFSQK